MPMRLKKNLEAVNKSLKAISQKVNQLAAAAEASGKSEAAKKQPVSSATSPKKSKMTAPEVVFGIIKRSRKGANIETLKQKSGFQGQKLHNVLHLLKKQGKILSEQKGLYTKA